VAADRAIEDFQARHSHGEIPDDMPEVTLSTHGKPMAVYQVLKQAGLTASTSEAMRMIEQGGVRVDGEKVTDKARQLVAGESFVVQVGKRKFARVSLG
jgi:tyrosyl-tRNA synthetase